MNAPRRGRSILTLVSNAIDGLDVQKVARNAGLSRVRYESHKPSSAWRGTPAEVVIGMTSLDKPTVVIEGPAREACLRTPQNANVASLVTLAGIALDSAEVTLVADPSAKHKRHSLVAEGAFGRAEFFIEGVPLSGNPKRSQLAALSLANAVFDDSAELTIR